LKKKKKLTADIERLRFILRAEESLKIYEWLSVENYLWAWSCVMSRSFWLNVSKRNSGIKKNQYSIIPLADLFNHSSSVETRGVFDDESQAYRIQTFTEYKKGDQVFICYGPHSNEILLKYYGFILSHNKFNSIRIFPPWEELNIIDKEWKVSLLSELHLNEGKYEITANEIPWNLLTKMRILLMEKEDYLQYSNAFLDEEISFRNEWRVWCFLRDIIQKRLVDKTSTINEDEKYLNEQGASLSYRLICAVKLRIEEKRVLHSILSYILKRIESLQREQINQ
jgi:hypothetical protein